MSGIKTYTETGYAVLYEDGSMKLNNSGYVQHLTPEMVQVAWTPRKRKLPIHPDVAKLMKADMEEEGLKGRELERAMNEYAPFRAGEYWDFGEELHIIPSKADFDNPNTSDWF